MDTPRKPRGRDGFSRLYRLRFWLEYFAFNIFGPSSTNDNRDPRVRARREYARRRSLRHEWEAAQSAAV